MFIYIFFLIAGLLFVPLVMIYRFYFEGLQPAGDENSKRELAVKMCLPNEDFWIKLFV